ncbi:hypothetical protein SAMN04489727_0967 [Amycolatopsis tolypomycina]|uniref:Uncharacterized protein n=1 Tax=Amycolatopsis tolypomycina TaxID=208445 RepID=A0A1H4IK88_9PSEU|nr:hypothetical protein [Amycolatopsis tolypomycina]SEB34323.1 hypothetical protein SAMN04489727_0967 [Amycolatopsis tolypomycina]
MSQGTEFHGRATAPAHPGRHRRGGAESWTPPLPQHRPVRHHAAGGLPVEPSGGGSQPRWQATTGSPEPGSPGLRFPADASPYYADPGPTGSHPLRPHAAHPAHDPATTGADRMTGADRSPSYSTGPGSADWSVGGNPPSWHHAGSSSLPHSSHADPLEVGSRPFRHCAGDSGPADPPVSGSLPLPQPSLPQPRDRRLGPPLFPASHGSLPLDDFDDDDDFEDGDEGEAPESRADQAARRTRVSLASPAPRCIDLDEDDVRVYSAPPLDGLGGLGGLGGFAIGSVPASVTPPKTWRKAAWFATGASGAVVVGLLCAGSFLVGKPPMDQAVQGAWPGYQGVPTIADPTGDRPPPTEGGSAAGPKTASRPDDDAAGTTQGGGGAGPVDGVAPPVDDSASAPGTATTGPADPSAPPRKPPVAPAQRETPVKPPWWYSFPPDAQTMGDNSEKFFNTVTTDPSAASSVTTGQLHDQGPQALAQRYAGIAYFEVKKVSIDQQRGVTVNTVEVTHTDGTKTLEERTLTFGDGDKITSDGQ